MTHNQIDYWNLQETKRSNLAKETETNRHNVAFENETNRHNVVSEGIDMGNLIELSRHNQATEYETNRHNVASESLDASKLQETQRHNIATEEIAAEKNEIEQELGRFRNTLALQANNLEARKLDQQAALYEQQIANAKQDRVLNIIKEVRQWLFGMQDRAQASSEAASKAAWLAL